MAFHLKTKKENLEGEKISQVLDLPFVITTGRSLIFFEHDGGFQR
jgi:hypothetical protein